MSINLSLQNLGKISTALKTGKINDVISAIGTMKPSDAVSNLRNLGISTEYIKEILRNMDVDESNMDDFFNAIDSLGDTGDIVSGLDKLKNAFNGFLGLLAPYAPLIIGAIAAAAVMAGGAYLEYATSLDYFADKATEAKTALSELSSEVDSLESQKASNEAKLAELESDKASAKENADEIASLRRKNNLLEAQIQYTKELESAQAKTSAEAARNALTAETYFQSGFRYIDAFGNKTGYYNQGEWTHVYGDHANIIEQSKEYEAELANLRAEYDALSDPNSDSFISDAEKRSDALETLSSKIRELSDQVLNNKLDIAEWYESLFDDGELINPADKYLARAIEASFPELAGANEYAQQIMSDYKSQVGDLSDLTISERNDLINQMDSWLSSIGSEGQKTAFDLWFNSDGAIKNLGDLQRAYENLQKSTPESITGVSVSKEREAISSITSAINEAKSATGLTADTVKTLTERYSDLTEFNPEALFQNTASGIRLNSTYLAQLEKLMESTNQSKFAQSIAQLTDEYNDLIAKRDEYLSKSKETEWNDEVKSLEEKIDAARQLQAEYAGLTNSYNDWLNAQSAPQSGDWHDAASERIKTLDELYKEGLYGNTELQEGLEFFTGIDIAGISDWEQRMQAVQTAYAQLDDTIPNTTHSLRDMMAAGKQGGQAYLDTLKQLGYATHDAAKNAWTLSDSFDVRKIAGAMKTTEEFVEMMNELLREYGFNIDTTQAQANSEEMKQRLIELRNAINELNAQTIKPNADTGEIEKAMESVREMIAAMQGDGVPAEQLSEFSKELAKLEIPTLEGLGFNFDNVDIKDIGEIAKAIEAQFSEIQVPVTTTDENTKDDGDEPAQEDVSATVNYIIGDQDPPSSMDATVNYKIGSQDPPSSMNATVNYIASGSFGGLMVNGTAHASGTAKANGDWGTAPGGKTLVGELGTEIVVDPHTGRWYTVGDYGAEFVDMPKDAIVFNHRQTESLLTQGNVVGRGKALAGGNAAVMVARIDSGGSKKKDSLYSNELFDAIVSQEIQDMMMNSAKTKQPTYVDAKSSNGGPGTGGSGRSGGGSGGDGSGGGGDEDVDRFDWIEILVERIERSIDNLAKIAESSYKALTKKLTASDDQIAKITEEIGIQEQARDLYLAEANEIELEDYQKWRARDGYLKISNYDKDTTEKIEEYRDLYEKSLEAEDKILELRETLAELYQDQFDYIQDDFDNQIEQIEYIITSYENGIDAIEERGLLGSTSYYSALQNITQQNITLLNNELEQLTAAFDKAMASGEIEEGSEAWYEMKSSINDVREEIDDANLSLLEYANLIRELNWENFDYILEHIGRIANESEFLIELMSNEKLFDDKGKFTEFADATTGLHAMNYNVYMSQADKYAEEIAKLNKEIAEDPYNTKLLDRREELLDLQYDSILAAEDEKQAIIDLVEEGIDIELDALQELIDKYTDALDSAKDLYEYNNQINDQTSEISTLRKQLMVYENNTSEEGRAKAQSIRAELKEAEKALEETEYDRYIDDQKKMLDDLYTEYEEILNERLDNTDAIIEEAIANTNLNTESINQTISDAAADVGYTLTEGMQEIWNNSFAELDGTIAIYGDGFSEKLTSINSVLDAIEEYVSAILAQSDAEAAKIINAKLADGNVKFKTGGLADFTGPAQLDGTPQKPELVLNANDTQNFLELNNLLRSMANKGIMFGSYQNFGVDEVSHSVGLADLSSGFTSIRTQPINTNTTFGDINITIPIDHVDDYNDFVNQLRDDRKFEEMIKGMTIGAITGENSLAKYKNIW